MSNYVFHLYSPVRGGITDYVDMLLENYSKSEKISIERQTDHQIFLQEQCLLHYSGYGYANRGAPLWLLNKVLTDRPRIKKLGIFFHEIYAFGPPWSSAFWLSPVQRHIARRLVEISDFWITNRESSAQWLRQFAGDKPHAVLPVFSNVGEMSAYAPQRAPKIIIFGSAALRVTTYRVAGTALFSWASQQGLEVHDIGPVINNPEISTMLQNFGVVQHGRLGLQEVSHQLADASFGVVAYPANYVAKSGVFAAYCAHGICPILISKHYAPSDGLLSGVNYVAGLPLAETKNASYQNIGSAAWTWYQPHRIMAHVNTINYLLNKVSTAC